MKKYFLVALFSVLFVQTVLAEIPPRPNRCPGEASIQSYGVSRNTIQIGPVWFAARRSFAYDTNSLWSFVIGNIRATSTNDAYLKATAALSTIFLFMGPFYDSFSTRWLCIYGTHQGYPALTAYPPLVGTFDKDLISRYLT